MMKPMPLHVVALSLFAITVPGLETARAFDGSGLQTSVAADIVGKAGAAGPGFSDRLTVRSAEAVFYGPIDHLFDGVVNIAAHQEANQAFFEIHEAYIGSSRLIPRSRFRIGHYFLTFGRLNQFHQHDWPFISAPKVQSAFFQKEAVIDTGLEYAYLTPLPFYLELAGGIANGWVFGHSHNIGDPSYFPTHYVRPVVYFSLPGEGGSQVGLNYIGRKDSNATGWRYFGLDVTAKWRESKNLLFLLQGELWHRTQSPRDAEAEKTLGGYIYPQYGLDENWQFGIRGDLFTVTSLKDAAGRSVSNGTYAMVPTLTYKVSEFSTIRSAYTFEWDKQPGAETELKHAFELQLVMILGAHPAHDF